MRQGPVSIRSRRVLSPLLHKRGPKARWGTAPAVELSCVAFREGSNRSAGSRILYERSPRISRTHREPTRSTSAFFSSGGHAIKPAIESRLIWTGGPPKSTIQNEIGPFRAPGDLDLDFSLNSAANRALSVPSGLIRVTDLDLDSTWRLRSTASRALGSRMPAEQELSHFVYAFQIADHIERVDRHGARNVRGQ